MNIIIIIMIIIVIIMINIIIRIITIMIITFLITLSHMNKSKVIYIIYCIKIAFVLKLLLLTFYKLIFGILSFISANLSF
jgi:hypothetical protein